MKTLKAHIPDLQDFTLYLPAEDEAWAQSLNLPGNELQSKHSQLFELTLTEEGADTLTGRALLSPCYGGRYWSLTVHPNSKRKVSRKKSHRWRSAVPEISGFAPSTVAQPKFLNTLSEVSEVVWEQIRQASQTAPSDVRGVLVISGPSSSAKSSVARALVNEYLFDRERMVRYEKAQRKLHLVTFEDPIERYLVNSPAQLSDTHIDYTPREVGRDVHTLSAALKDALRQSPAVLYVGETRTPSEWLEILQYAETGGLVVTTCHANSVITAVATLFQAVGAKTPMERAAIADRLLAVVNLALIDVDGFGLKALVPAMWARSEDAKAALAADGLSALIPGTAASPEINRSGSLGRTWFARALLQKASAQELQDLDNVGSSLLKRALDLDLEGI